MVLVPRGQGLGVIHRHSGGKRASHAAHTPRHSSQSWAPGGRGVMPGEAAQDGPR